MQGLAMGRLDQAVVYLLLITITGCTAQLPPSDEFPEFEVIKHAGSRIPSQGQPHKTPPKKLPLPMRNDFQGVVNQNLNKYLDRLADEQNNSDKEEEAVFVIEELDTNSYVDESDAEIGDSLATKNREPQNQGEQTIDQLREAYERLDREEPAVGIRQVMGLFENQEKAAKKEEKTKLDEKDNHATTVPNMASNKPAEKSPKTERNTVKKKIPQKLIQQFGHQKFSESSKQVLKLAKNTEESLNNDNNKAVVVEMTQKPAATQKKSVEEGKDSAYDVQKNGADKSQKPNAISATTMDSEDIEAKMKNWLSKHLDDPDNKEKLLKELKEDIESGKLEAPLPWSKKKTAEKVHGSPYGRVFKK